MVQLRCKTVIAYNFIISETHLWSRKRNFHSKLCLEVNSSLGSSTVHISCREEVMNTSLCNNTAQLLDLPVK